MSTPTIDLPFTNVDNSSVDYDISFGNLLSNSPLFIEVERLFQSPFVSEPTTVTESNEFLYSYQQIEFRDGSYYAPLPWKNVHPPLPSNSTLSKQRLAQVTSRLVSINSVLCKPVVTIWLNT